MKWSLSLGRIAGTRLQVHWTFLILLGWIVARELNKGSDLTTVLATVGFILAIFACVILHEFGHATMARKYGIGTRSITLLPIGGVARLERMPEDPKQELMVAIAGPAVNVVIGLLLYLIIPFERLAQQISEQEELNLLSVDNFLFSLFFVNVILVVFNAIPAFPMDGGRVLRALLAMKLGRVKATRIASGLGQILAMGFVFLGLLYNPFLIFIGVFVFFGAYAENIAVQQLSFLKGYTVREAMMTRFVTLPATDKLQVAVDQLLEGSEREFIITDQGKVAGVLTTSTLVEALKAKGRDGQIAEVLPPDFTTFDAGQDLAEVYSIIQQQKASFFPVLENGQLVGAIDQQNISEFVLVQSALSY